jgi:hypothetical protein
MMMSRLRYLRFVKGRGSISVARRSISLLCALSHEMYAGAGYHPTLPHFHQHGISTMVDCSTCEFHFPFFLRGSSIL